MKKAVALLLVLVIFSGICLTGCGGSDDGLDMVSSYMKNDNTVVVKFRNETNKTISYVSGSLNLFTGSRNSQTPIKTASFTWNGTCEKGRTFEVTVRVSNPPAGLADDVNRIGFHISDIR